MESYQWKFKSYLPVLYLLLLITSCKKAIEISAPPNALTPDKVFDNDASAVAATLSDYTSLAVFDGNFIQYAGQYVDELSQPTLNTTSAEFASGSLMTTNGAVANIWQNLYQTIYKANANIEQLKNASALTDSVKKQCTGEALLIRAYCHFYLLNIFGAVPLITTTDVTVTSNEPRTPVSQVYAQVEADLLRAAPLLSVGYPAGGKIRPNRLAAQALLARVDLYEQKWAEAEAQADAVISSGLYPLAPLSTVFYQNSPETIWQLWNANGFITALSIPAASGVPAYTISNQLAASFETGDLRKVNWTLAVAVSGTAYAAPFKYKLRSATTAMNAEYLVYLRSAEQYLIRAEARAQQGELDGAISDLNVIRKRAGLADLASSLAQAQVLAAVAQERRVELFDEGGHRYFDLKRTGQLNAVMSVLKTTWNTIRSPLFPVPLGQMSINASLVQNLGY